MLVRHTKTEEIEEISCLLSENAKLLEKHFGQIDIDSWIERSCIALTVVDHDGEIIGFASFVDYPPSVQGNQWNEKFKHTKYLTTENSLKLCCFAIKETTGSEDYDEILASDVLNKLFCCIPEIDYILLSLIDNVPPFSPLDQFFKPITLPVGSESSEKNILYICERASVGEVKKSEDTPNVSVLNIRLAKVEDYDDLLPIFKHQSNLQEPDEFYLARLIESQDDNNQTLVAEVNGRAVGMLSMTSKVDIAQISSNFQMEKYQNLKALSGSLTSDTYDEPPDVTNSVVVTSFCLSKEHSTRAIDFLKHAFVVFPTKTYLFATLPHNTREGSLLRYFSMVPSFTFTAFPHDLYLLHRLGMYCQINVTEATTDHLERFYDYINFLLHSEEEKVAAKEQLEKCTNFNIECGSSERRALTITEGERIVGIAIVDSPDDAEFLASNYEIESFIRFSAHQPHELTELHLFLLHPAYESKKRIVLKEILRVLKKTCIYHKGYQKKSATSNNNHCLSSHTVISELYNVQRRRQVELVASNAEKENSFALHFLPKRGIYQPKVTINSRIVVVGASDSGISFLETLSFIPHLNFTHLFLVSPNGLPSGDTTFLPNSLYSKKEYNQMLLQDKVETVCSKMVGIDRETHHIHLKNGQSLRYDYLVLTTGTVDKSISNLGHKEPILGVFTLQNEESTIDLEKYFNQMIHTQTGVVVYGNSLKAFTTLHGLIERKYCSPNAITLVLPTLQSSFLDEVVDTQIQTTVEQMGIVCYRGYELYKLDTMPTQGGSELKSAYVRSGDKEVKIDCNVIITCNSENEGVDPDTFHAIIDSCLVYDGSLVIDTNFRTNDKCIYSIGKLARYSNNLKIKRLPFHCYNSKELGSILASSILEILDPNGEIKFDDERQFTTPKIRGGVVIGGIHFFQASKPEMSGPPTLKGSKVLCTVNANHYCSINIDKYGYVESITYLGTERIQANNLSCLIGMHERYMNNMVSRYDEGIITDFPSYFREKWATALFHDRFRKFQSSVRQEFLKSKEIWKLREQIETMVENERIIDKETKEKLAKSVSLQIRALIESKLINYVAENTRQLSMYIVPKVKK